MKLLREGRSFSGRERNCVFLNSGSPRFANVSAITGLDFADDGRALAVVDWDQDGDLDLWFFNRTGPRLRLMCNQTIAADREHKNRFLALRLQGTTSNRDAIGARVEVVLKELETEDRRLKTEDRTHEDVPRRSPSATRQLPLIQTLYAGDAYLSQSSKWLHFGLGREATIDYVTVRWPHGEVERFTDIDADCRYLLVEASGQAKKKDAPRQLARLTASRQTTSKSAPASRIMLSNRLPMPVLRAKAFDGSELPAIEPDDGPLLINFWASWCIPCVGELEELTEHRDRLREAGLDILALSVDGLSADRPGSSSDAQRVLEKIDVPFSTGVATRELLDKLVLVQRIVLNRQPPFAVPTSILLDRHGHLAAIYRGPVSVDVLCDDIAQLDTSPDSRRDLAIPFSGRWSSAPRNLLLQPVANVFKERGLREDYARYVEMDIELKDRARRVATSDEERKRIDEQYAVMHFNLARTLQAEGQIEEAIYHYRQGLAAKPDDGQAHYLLGRALSADRKDETAIEHFRRALRADPKLVAAHIHLGKALRSRGKTAGAIGHYRQALAERPDAVEAHFNLGVALAAQEELDAAIESFRRALKLQPDHAEAHINLGALLASRGDLETGIKHLYQAVQLKPDNLQARLNLGGALGSRRDFQGAAGQFRRVIAIRPDVSQAHARLAQALLELGNAAEAAGHLERAISLNPADGGSMLRLAWLRATSTADELRDGSRAVELAERLREATNNMDPRVLDALAAAYAENGNFDAAAQTAAQALTKLGPNQSRQTAAIQKRLELYQRGQPYREVRNERPSS